MNWSPRSTKAMPPERPRSSRPSTSVPRNSIISSRSPTWTATWLIPTRRATCLLGNLGPDRGELDDRRRCSGHVLHARPLPDRVVLLAAGEEVRRRQALRREDGPVGASPRDGEPGLDPRPANRLERSVHDPGILLDERPHVAVRLAHLDVDLGARLAQLHVGGEAAQELQMLLEQRVVMVARDEVDDRLFGVARDAVWMDVPLAPLRRLG